MNLGTGGPKLVTAVQRERSSALRRAMTPPEARFWNAVRAHRFHALGFRRQVPIAGFIVDFVCLERQLIVEIDGATHGGDDDLMRDASRTRRLEQEGFRVVRFWNNDVMTNLEGVPVRLKEELLIRDEILGSTPVTDR